jgi:phage head maturation protease
MILDRIRGRAAVYGAWSDPITEDGVTFREIIRAGALRLSVAPLRCDVDHSHVQLAWTGDRSLRAWVDSAGIAVEIDVPATMSGAGLRDMVARCDMRMSMLMRDVRCERTHGPEGARREVSFAVVDSVTITAFPAYPTTACWLASTPAEHLPAHVAAAARQWRLGKIEHERSVEADRRLLQAHLQPRASARPKARGNIFASAMSWPQVRDAARRLGFATPE